MPFKKQPAFRLTDTAELPTDTAENAISIF
jgi:hypothetical protein